MDKLSEIPQVDLSDAELMAKYGITCDPAARFHYKFFRYSRLADAVAQARRYRPLSAMVDV